MSLENLDRRIEKMLAAIELQRGPEQQAITVKFHLFTSSEQARIHALLDVLYLKVTYDSTGHIDLSELTWQELSELKNWLKLQQALEQEDIEAAAMYRRSLHETPEQQEQLIETFLALDESMIPAFDQAPTVELQGTRYTLYRTAFRSDRAMVQRAIATNGPGIGLEKIRLWCDTFAAQAAV